MKNPILAALSSITLGASVSHLNLTMIPLVGTNAVEQEPDYLTLDQALSDGSAEVTEISEQGSVPELRIINKGAKPVFILPFDFAQGSPSNVEGSTVKSSSAPSKTASSTCRFSCRPRPRSPFQCRVWRRDGAPRPWPGQP